MRPFRRLWTMRRRPPSPVAVERFARDVDREVSDLRAGLADDLILAMLLLENGEHEEASHVVDVGSERLRRFHDSLERSVAAAAVEREAEAVLAGVRRDADGRDDRRHPIRVVASALATAVAVIGALSVVAEPPSSSSPLLAGAFGERDAAVSTDVAHRPVRDALAQRYDRTPTDAVTADAPFSRPTDGVDVLRLFDGGRTTITRLGERSGGPLAVLLGVERLVAGLLPTEPPPSIIQKLEQIEGTGGPADGGHPATVGDAGPSADGTASEEPVEDPSVSEEPQSPPSGSPEPSETPTDGSSEDAATPSEEPSGSGDDPDGTDGDEPAPWSPDDAAGATAGGGSSGGSGSGSAGEDDDGIF